jgi:hypothetical protein
MGKERVELSRVAARDPKSRLSANSSTSPIRFSEIIRERNFIVNDMIILRCKNHVNVRV